jgi:dolichyl-phosphate-mannose-protein mannosyltransferase
MTAYTAPPSQTAAEKPSGSARESTSEHGAVRMYLSRGADALLPPTHQRPIWSLLIACFLLRMLWLVQPAGELIFDEEYYVNAARAIAGIHPGSVHYEESPLGLDPNTEHPPLAKLLVAGSIRVLGDNAFGWRLPSVLLGTLSVLLLYGITNRLGAGRETALLAAGLLAFDNLVFVHSRIFTLDIFQLAFMLLGVYWYVSGRAAPAGVAFALAALSKIGGILGVVALIVYEAIRLFRGDESWRAVWRTPARRLIILVAVFGATFLVLLGLMDRVWVGYQQPFEHLDRILSYGSILRRPDGPLGSESYPWQWLWNDGQISYATIQEEITEDDELIGERPLVLFRGAMNPFVLQLWPLGLAFAGYLWWRRRPDADLGALSLAWFLVNFLPFCAVSLFAQRISYIHYFLPTIPAIALAGSAYLLRGGVPRVVLWVYLAAVLLAFCGYFPFRFYPHLGSEPVG